MLNKIGRRESKRPRIAALEPHFSDVSGEVRGTEDVNGEGDFQQLGPAAERMSSPIPPRNPRDTHDTVTPLRIRCEKMFIFFLLFNFIVFLCGSPCCHNPLWLLGGPTSLFEVYSSFPN